ncbi:hypothetical protein [Oerskovia enterophila]|uniref:hypothetical protein n=1 Tax=Oerskovia enterophila TaxID=43678 RepID=UPI0038245173
MTVPPPATAALPSRTLRTASIVVLAFAAMFLLFGLSMLGAALGPGLEARELVASGRSGTVTDARVHSWSADQQMHSSLELTFTGTDGEQLVAETDHRPEYVRGRSVTGWADEFQGKEQLIGRPVTYLLGDPPTVELTSELPALASGGWGFPHFLGLAFVVIGCGAAVGGLISLHRARRRMTLERS